MIADMECSFCDGSGRVARNSPLGGCDPFDPGRDCPKCHGSGVVQVDLNDEADDE